MEPKASANGSVQQKPETEIGTSLEDARKLDAISPKTLRRCERIAIRRRKELELETKKAQKGGGESAG